MKAERLYKKILCNIKGGFSIKTAINRARKHNLKDAAGEIMHYTGMSSEQAKEFTAAEELK